MKERNEDHEQPLNLGSLKTSSEPPQDLEERVISALRKNHLIGKPVPPRGWLRLIPAAAASLFFFFAGVLYEKYVPVRSTSTQKSGIVSMSDSTYVLFLLQGAAYQEATNQQQLTERVEEYREWAMELRNKGIPVNGTKLRDEKNILGSGVNSVPSREEISGYFLIDARNPEEALTIASKHPHLKYGGTIQVRRVHPV